MKLTVIGAGSAYAPEIFDGLIARRDASKITILICCRERSVSFALRTPPVRSRRRGGCTGHPAIQRRKTYEREI